jgi:hypothetical protein
MIDTDSPDPRKFVRADLVWDLVKHTEVSRVLQKLDMIPLGPDGQAMACMDSHVRMAYADIIGPQISYLAAEISHIMMTAILEDTETDEETRNALVLQQTYFMELGARVMVAHLVAARILAIEGLDQG